MDTSFLDNQEELNIESFNGSFRKALEQGKTEESNNQTSGKKQKKSTKKTLIDIPKSSTPDSVRISISKTNDKKIREIILNHYVQTGERLSIKQFVDNCICIYIEKNFK